MLILAELKTYLIEQLPMMTADKCHLMIVNGQYNDGFLDYTARLLLLDYRDDPILAMVMIKNWLKSKNRHLAKDQITEIQISFSSEIIDQDTFDLEIDFPQRDKINIADATYTICRPVVWDDDANDWITT